MKRQCSDLFNWGGAVSFCTYDEHAAYEDEMAENGELVESATDENEGSETRIRQRRSGEPSKVFSYAKLRLVNAGQNCSGER